MVKALADRLAEAFAEKVHADIRRDLWGYAPDETMDAAAMHHIKYDGIRPAPGYPSQPDHTEKRALWEMLECAQHAPGLTLTESLAMAPAASVSALVFAHPQSRYFAVGNVTDEQVEDYASRKGVALEDARTALRTHLASEAV